MILTSADQCAVIRETSNPRWDRQSDAFSPDPALWAPGCGHAACVADDRGDACIGGGGFHDWDCPVAQCRYETLKATCDRERGHDGAHEFYQAAPAGATP